MAKLDRYNKFDVKEGDMLRFDYGDSYIVTHVSYTYFPSTGKIRGASFSLQDTKTRRIIYGHPSSECYGAEWIPQD